VTAPSLSLPNLQVIESHIAAMSAIIAQTRPRQTEQHKTSTSTNRSAPLLGASSLTASSVSTNKKISATIPIPKATTEMSTSGISLNASQAKLPGQKIMPDQTTLNLKNRCVALVGKFQRISRQVLQSFIALQGGTAVDIRATVFSICVYGGNSLQMSLPAHVEIYSEDEFLVKAVLVTPTHNAATVDWKTSNAGPSTSERATLANTKEDLSRQLHKSPLQVYSKTSQMSAQIAPAFKMRAVQVVGKPALHSNPPTSSSAQANSSASIRVRSHTAANPALPFINRPVTDPLPPKGQEKEQQEEKEPDDSLSIKTVFPELLDFGSHHLNLPSPLNFAFANLTWSNIVKQNDQAQHKKAKEEATKPVNTLRDNETTRLDSMALSKEPTVLDTPLPISYTLQPISMSKKDASDEQQHLSSSLLQNESNSTNIMQSSYPHHNSESHLTSLSSPDILEIQDLPRISRQTVHEADNDSDNDSDSDIEVIVPSAKVEMNANTQHQPAHDSPVPMILKDIQSFLSQIKQRLFVATVIPRYEDIEDDIIALQNLHETWSEMLQQLQNQRKSKVVGRDDPMEVSVGPQPSSLVEEHSIPCPKQDRKRLSSDMTNDEPFIIQNKPKMNRKAFTI
jgi:hypothetical protein